MSRDPATLERLLGAKSVGEPGEVLGLAAPSDPFPGSVVVVATATDLETLAAHEHGAAVALLVVPRGLELTTPLPQLQVEDTRLALARLTKLFDRWPPAAEGVHPTAQVHPEAKLAEDVHLGAGASVGAGAIIGSGTRVGANTVIGAGVQLGENCLLHPNTTLYSGAALGDRVILHSGCVVGGDGFGYARGERGAEKIHHLGGVILEDDVEVGANSCIDRGTLLDTRIGARSKIDNLCQIGHNVILGSDCLIAGGVAIGGSTTFGNRVTVGGQAGVADHITIGDDVRVAAGAGVTKNVPSGETWAGFPAQPYRRWVRGLYLQNKLEAIWDFVRTRRA